MQRPLSVLLAEDDPVHRYLVRALLERDGHRVVPAATGPAALTRAAGGGLDVALIDIRMPEMDGPETARQIRSLPDRDMASLPLIAMAGPADAADLDRCRAAGMGWILHKPASPEGLRQVLKESLASGSAGGTIQGNLDRMLLDGHRRALGAGRLRTVIDDFLAGAEPTVARIHEAIARNDLAALAKAAHKLGGGALTVGLWELGELARTAEAQIKTGTAEKALATAARIPALFQAGAEALRRYAIELET